MRASRLAVFLSCAAFALTLGAGAHERHQHEREPGKAEPARTETPLARQSGKSEWQMVRSHLRKPEYLHVLINPIPMFGSALASILLLLALCKPDPGVRAAGLSLALATGIIVFPTIQWGQNAYDRVYETIPLEAQEWLDVHMERAEKFQYVFYLGALLALGALVAGRRRSRWAAPLTKAALAASALAAGLASWIAHAGGQARHDEFREGPPPASAIRKAPPEPAPGRESRP